MSDPYIHNIQLLIRGGTGYRSFFCQLVSRVSSADNYSEQWGGLHYTDYGVVLPLHLLKLLPVFGKHI